MGKEGKKEGRNEGGRKGIISEKDGKKEKEKE